MKIMGMFKEFLNGKCVKASYTENGYYIKYNSKLDLFYLITPKGNMEEIECIECGIYGNDETVVTFYSDKDNELEIGMKDVIYFNEPINETELGCMKWIVYNELIKTEGIEKALNKVTSMDDYEIKEIYENITN